MEKLGKIITKVIDIWAKALAVIGSITLTIFFGAVIAQMFCRYLGIMALWTEEVSTYAFIFTVFMGAAALVRENKHFAFTAISDGIKNPLIKKLISILISVIVLVFAYYMFVYGKQLMQKFWNYKWVSLPSMKRGYTWMCVPVSAVSMMVFSAESIVKQVWGLVKGGKA
ncbi:MAG: TRAP transporter small permease subunit [Clostridia bacterium]|nr:TRAP transporter small permease subunit [Clostridia bacterium]MBQ6859063.1 TRAP transporter small permease subunit [Clostridia bacterium]